MINLLIEIQLVIDLHSVCQSELQSNRFRNHDKGRDQTWNGKDMSYPLLLFVISHYCIYFVVGFKEKQYTIGLVSEIQSTNALGHLADFSYICHQDTVGRCPVPIKP